MALTDKVTARYSAQKLIEFTNPDVPGAGAIDAARLAAAAADATGDFLRFVGVAYDDANAAHVGPAVHRVFALLAKAMDPVSAFAKELLGDTQTELLDLRDRIGAGQRLALVTDAPYTPSTIDTTHGPVRPDMDAENFRDVLLDPPPLANP